MATWKVTTATSDDACIVEEIDADHLDQHGETIVLWKDSERVAVVSQKCLVTIVRVADEEQTGRDGLSFALPTAEAGKPARARAAKAARKKGRG